jgi:hypothetical protein
MRRGRLGGGSRSVAWLACVFVSFKCLRYGFDMPIEVEQRVVHLAVPRVTIYRGTSESQSKCYVPYNPLRVDEERDTSWGEAHQATWDAVCLATLARLITQHRVLSFVVRKSK